MTPSRRGGGVGLPRCSAPPERSTADRRARSAVPVDPSALTAVVVALCVMATAVVLGVLAAAPASAHDTLLSTDPPNGATVATAPDRVTLTFDEPAVVIGTTVRVIGPDGDVQSGAPRLVDSTVTQELTPGTPAGSYRIAWRATSADGHPVSGELTFTAAAPNPRAAPTNPPPTAGSPAATTPTAGGAPSTWVWVIVVMLVLVGGGVAFLLRRRRLTINRPGATSR